MARYQVTVAYKIIVNDAESENSAKWCAVYAIGKDPCRYNNITAEEIHTPKCCGLRAQTYVIDDVIGPSDLDEDHIHLSDRKDYIETLESFRDYLKEHKAQQEKILNTLKERLGETKGE